MNAEARMSIVDPSISRELRLEGRGLYIEWSAELEKWNEKDKKALLEQVAVNPVYCDDLDPTSDLSSGLVIENRMAFVWEIVWVYQPENNGCYEEADPYQTTHIYPQLRMQTLNEWAKSF